MYNLKCKIVLAALAAITLTACSPNDPQHQTVQAQLLPEGGVCNLSNGVSLIVPPGAVSTPTDVTVEYLQDLDETVGSLPSDIQGRLRLSPEGLIFDKPIGVTMPLNQPVTDDSLDIVFWSEQDKTWYITDRGKVEGNKVSFTIEHFSNYASIGGAWGDLLRMMDNAVGSAQSQAEISSALHSFLADMWSKMDLESFRWATRANMAGGAVSTCAQPCGLFASWACQENDNDRQGAALYKDETTHNIISTLGLSNAQMSQHLQNNYQVRADRILEMYGEPCATVLQGTASPNNIEKGQTASVTILASCDGDPLPGQLIQLSYSPELSCDVVDKKTDDNGQVTISVKGEEEGIGIVYAKAVNALNSDLVTEIQVPVKIGPGEQWRITIDVQGRCYSAFSENYNVPFYSTNYRFSGDEQEITFAYTLVYDLNVKATGQATGTVSVTNYPNQFHYTVPAFSQSGDWVETNGISYHAESAHSGLTASPEFRTVKDVAVKGVCSAEHKMASLALTDFDMGATLEGYEKYINGCTFLFPNAFGTWTFQAQDESEAGDYFFGKISSMNVAKNIDGHYYINYSYLCLPAYLMLENFGEMEQTFEQTGESSSGTDLKVTVNGNELELPVLDNAIGKYTLFNEPAYWGGEVHTTLSGTLKIENLSKQANN